MRTTQENEIDYPPRKPQNREEFLEYTQYIVMQRRDVFQAEIEKFEFGKWQVSQIYGIPNTSVTY